MKNYTDFTSVAVKSKFYAYPDSVKFKLLDLRELIYAVASITPGVGELEETLKWDEPSYRSGTPLAERNSKSTG